MAGSVGSDDGDMGFQIAPMIDVVFVLVLYFMANVGMQVNEKELSVDLPAIGAPGSAATASPSFIDINASGQVLFNNEPLDNPQDTDLPMLRAKLLALMQTSPDDTIIIRPDLETTHDRVVDVLNAAASSGVTKLTFS